MPLRPSGRLPQRFRRGFTRKTRTLVKRRYERRKSMHQERVRRTMRRAHQLFMQWQNAFLRWGLIVAGCIVVLIGSLLLFSPILQLREIKVYRNSPRLNVEQVQQVLLPLFGRHLFFLPFSEVDAMLRAQIADIETVAIDKAYPSQLLVHVELDPLVARLEIINPESEQEAATGSGTGMDFLSKRGIYVQTPVADGEEELPVIRVVDWGARPTSGTELASSDLIAMIWAAEEALRTQFGHEIQTRALYVRSQEFHIQADGISLWFDRRSTLEKQIQRYRIFLQSVPRADIQRYIDLRLRDRVVYE